MRDFDRIHYGADYNPDHTSPGVWDEDVKLMAEAGVTMVTVGIFSWANVEPRPGEWDFGWFDTVMDKLSSAGISACLATMTASPPPWLSHRHPEILPVRADGTRLSAGSRQQFCPSSPVFREHAARLAEQVATRYGRHPALAMWHIGNEYGCHIRGCYCDVSAADFRSWLENRYDSIDALNEAWSTTFWSQRYSEFAEILPPRAAPSFGNPAQQLDFHRFSSDASLGCYLVEKEVLDRITPGIPVTTNFVGRVQKALDWNRWAPRESVVSLDSYPDPADPRAHVEAAFAYDLCRSLKDGQPWMLLEQAPGAVNWRPTNVAKAPGAMRLGSWQAVAQGSDALVFFQWRQTRGGAEKFHSAMVPHGGAETRVFADVRALGQEVASAAKVAGSRVRAEVALLHDWENWWGVELAAHPSEVDHLETQLAHYAPLFDAGITCDVVHPGADLSRYKLVVVPNLYLMSEETAANLRAYVERGGHLVVSYFSGIVDECDRVHLGGYPAPLRELLGLRVDEFQPLSRGVSIRLRFDDGAEGEGVLWSEWIETEGAEVVAGFAAGDLDGRPAITRNAYGQGVSWYLGTRPEPAAMRSLFDRITAGADARPVLPGLPEGVQAVVRRGTDSAYLFLLNHGTDEVTVTLPEPASDLLTDPDSPVSAVSLAPRGVAILERGA
ncbi:beta-galactosidase [Amycolatopsis acidicola]|uniref:Beta-galactosidase n=1 Tax=Amycolatopsis acidicola TaxID=2596893 RepID=A0A5N0UQS1_9PSEU|nr:beta-galactosidase [Amycolatopsis acidicola]KAA9152656.1 beta-galactosidase [Amycolatopsis acidicola]